jgi:hypothetical protein
MFTTARLSIDNFRTSVRLTADTWKPGDPHDRFDVNWVGANDWRPAADAELADHGYRRTGDWVRDDNPTEYIAPIAAN